ncbi:MAG TPA: class I SAM-dependent methyltransferase [Actinophytocola sp.]|uniref:class I SAM-dependent methyltransferase n=1 Tax=Actinophytocola sp. TaxID=1872138 RepID=UPI002DB890B0|nr:class I SAM-dependent methyltransferase [Actinophytocola sp.]HEU5471555.1 class I SAM-dependent methyltransferase [Actinophytocola sp.]
MTTTDLGDRSAFTDRVIADLATAAHAATVVLGDRLGLYRALADAGPATPAEVAASADCDERYVIEWLNAQAAAGYCGYDEETGRYWLTEEQAACLADEDGPEFLAAGMMVAGALFKIEGRLADAVRTGRGFSWADHHHDLFAGLERFTRPSYQAHLVEHWIPALDGMSARLATGARVADVGCGRGAATILLASAFPAATVVGFDLHGPSLGYARKTAVEAGVADRVRFEVAGAQDFPGAGYDLVCMLDALHDMADPVGAAARIRAALSPDGVWLLVEPVAGETVAANLTEAGRLYYSLSTLVCTPAARAQPGGWALGAAASEAQLRGLCARAGFSRFRSIAANRLHRVFEVRP